MTFGETGQVPGGADLTALARRWAAEVGDTSFIELSRDGLREHLRGLAERLAVALTGDVLDERVGYETGEALVAIHLTKVDAVRRTIAVLAELPAALGRDDAPTRSRMGPLLGAVAAGFAAAQQQRTLAEQENIRQAALAARLDAEHALRAGQARVRAVFEAAAVAIAIGDLQGRLVEANPALAEMLGVPLPELPGRSVFDFFHPDDVPDLYEQVYQRLGSGTGPGGRVRLEKRFLRADGEIGWTMLAISLVREPDGTPAYLVAMGEDVTERHRLEQALHHQAHHDPLTGLPNRSLLYQRLATTIREATPRCRIGLCFLDLDEFKAVNDTLGHGVGDRLLAAVAGRLQERVTAAGHFIARVGGDEFVVVVSGGEGPQPVIAVAESMLGALARPFHVDGHELVVSASVGLVERPAAGADPEEIMRAADATLYWAKADGRGRWALYDPARNNRQVMSYALATGLPAALERGEFGLDYQPIVDPASGLLRGAEALVRWHHPDLGVLRPDRFLALAERAGHISRLGRWVLREACDQARIWQDRLADPPFVSVNLSLRQCVDTQLVADVTGALEATGLHPGRLQLELTENALSQPYDGAVAALETLARLGVRIAIDNFGVGYANLARLHRLPVHGLKLAGSLVGGLDQGNRAGAGGGPGEQIVLMLVSLAHTLGLTVTAESVESARQASRLAELRCDLAQGLFFGPPGPPADVLRLAGRGVPEGSCHP